MIDLNDNLYSEILPGLFMGGTADEDVVNVPKQLRNLDEQIPFDSVVTCYSWAQPMGWHVHENRFGFADGLIEESTFQKLVSIAHWLHKEWKSGKRCLIRCQAGWNRSGLCTALVLLTEGYTPQEALTLIRSKRSPQALSNKHFVDLLYAYSSKIDSEEMAKKENILEN